MEILYLPDGRPLVLLMREVYRDDEQRFSLGYRRLLGVLRIARAIEDQLGVDEADAVMLAAESIGVERSPVLA